MEVKFIRGALHSPNILPFIRIGHHEQTLHSRIYQRTLDLQRDQPPRSASCVGLWPARHIRTPCPRHLRPGQVCADDITRAGWPLQFYEEGGFAYRSEFSLSSLLINVGLGVGASAIAGWLYAWRKNGPPKQNLCAIMPPTWNTVCASSTTIITTMTTIPRSLGEALLVNK